MTKKRRRNPFAPGAVIGRHAVWGVESEFVTDDLLLVMITIPVVDLRTSGSGWLMALACDEVASRADDEPGMFFRSWDLEFDQARAMLKARKLKDRKTALYRRSAP